MKNKTSIKVLMMLSSILVISPFAINAQEENITSNQGIEINDVNFPDPDFQKYISEYYDKSVQDGYLSDEEISKVKNISLWDWQYENCASVEGLQYFKNLETLYIQKKKNITKVDISQNKKLKKLVITDTPIKDLNVKSHLALEDLSCDNTDISELDVSENTKLMSLSCINTKVQNINVTKNEDLQVLNVSYTNIKELNISKNTKLETLYCNNTSINTLDISNHDKLTVLYCGDTNIKSLDIRNCPKLRGINATNTPLGYINIGTECKELDDLEIDTLSIVPLEITDDNFSITEVFSGIDINKISNLQGGTLEGDIVKLTSLENFSYTYECGNIKDRFDGTYSKKMINVNVQLSLLQSDSTIAIGDSLDTLTYTGKAMDSPSVVVTGSSGAIDIRYDKKIGSTWQELTTLPVEAGTYRIRVQVEEDTFYKGANKMREFDIKKAIPSYSTPTNIKAKLNKTLQDILLPKGFAWMDSTAVLENKGEQIYKVRYVPNDTSNYEIVENIDIGVMVEGIEHNITILNEGKGITQVDVDKAFEGTVVTLKSMAELGYMLKEYQIVQGNCTIENHHFVMPDEDIVIKAIYCEVLPEVDNKTNESVQTGDTTEILGYSFLFIGCLLAGTIIRKKR